MKLMLAILSLVGFLFISSGCKMATTDRKAIRIYLNFQDPESFPFIKLDKLELRENNHYTYQWASGLSKAEIKRLLKQGYTKEYLIFAKIYLYTMDTASAQWVPITQYSVLYLGIADGYLWPRKKESYHPNNALLDFNGHDRTGPYASINFTEAILDFSQKSTVSLKIVVVPSIGDAKPRYWTADIKREELGLWIDEFQQNIWPFNWTVYMQEARITLPPWSEWHPEFAPPSETVPPTEEIVIKTWNSSKDSKDIIVYEIEH